MARFLLGASVVLIAATIVGYFSTQMTTNSMLKINDMMKDVSEGVGDLTKRLDIQTQDEIVEVSTNFNNFVTYADTFGKERCLLVFSVAPYTCRA